MVEEIDVVDDIVRKVVGLNSMHQLEMDGIDGGGHRCCGRHREEGGWTQLNAPAGDGRD